MNESAEFPVRQAGCIPYVAAAVLEQVGCLRHFFCGRQGGSSQGLYASLNVSYAVRDERSAVDKNRSYMWAQLGLACAPVMPRQVHGDEVVVVTRENLDEVQGRPPEADALITRLTGIPLAMLTADCLAIIVCDQRTPALGVIHAGWRGTVRATVWKTILTMIEVFGTQPEDCVAAVGPAIAGPCYEVGEDVREALVKGLPYGRDVLTPAGESRWRADLREANRRQLVDGRIPPSQVSICPYCVHCEAEWFFSARRDPVGGRQATVAVLR